ncbi:MAG: hypothetical protein C5B51_09020 [Terriglobia bacterium]|nr:MAG: hypothetical protein C5B51_09020 [Terriglobia bacterium]
MQAVENPIRPEQIREPMPLQIGLHMNECQRYASLIEILLQFPNDARGGGRGSPVFRFPSDQPYFNRLCDSGPGSMAGPSQSHRRSGAKHHP